MTDNRWAAFTDDELDHIDYDWPDVEHAGNDAAFANLIREVDAERKRRTEVNDPS